MTERTFVITISEQASDNTREMLVEGSLTIASDGDDLPFDACRALQMLLDEMLDHYVDELIEEECEGERN